MANFVRLVTIHPVLVHLTLGGVPLFVLAYAMAWARRSERWTFVGDAVLVMTALVSVATMAFGLVSNAAVGWPGGLGTWRWLHFGFGIGLSACLLAFAGLRLLLRRRHATAGLRTLGSSLALGLVAAVTGWFGGEVLVYHAGMAVEAAGDGAMAPPFFLGAPGSVRKTMHVLRATWAAAITRAEWMVVHRPSSSSFEEVATQARHLREGALWLAKTPVLAGDAKVLASDAGQLETAARKHELIPTLQAASAAVATCARCHEEFRWTKGGD